MAGLSATQRTLRALRERGLVAAVVERWNAHAGIRQDLFQIIDIIALDPVRGVVGVQSTTGQQMPDHRRKLLEEKAQATRDWLTTPGTSLELWGWRKVKRRRKDGSWGQGEFWEPRIEIVRLDMLS